MLPKSGEVDGEIIIAENLVDDSFPKFIPAFVTPPQHATNARGEPFI
jgi:hypothetical protein